MIYIISYTCNLLFDRVPFGRSHSFFSFSSLPNLCPAQPLHSLHPASSLTIHTIRYQPSPLSLLLIPLLRDGYLRTAHLRTNSTHAREEEGEWGTQDSIRLNIEINHTISNDTEARRWTRVDADEKYMSVKEQEAVTKNKSISIVDWNCCLSIKNMYFVSPRN